MCRRQPGPRCPNHVRGTISRHANQLEKVKARLDNANPGTKAHTYEQAKYAQLSDEILCDRVDLDSTQWQRHKLEEELVSLCEAERIDRTKVATTARSLLGGHLMHAERVRQNRLVPRRPKAMSKETEAAYDELCNARADMARYKVQMDLSGANEEEWSRWRDKHAEAANRALVADAHFAVSHKDGEGAWAGAGNAGRDAAKEASRDRSDFTTPDAPVSITEVASRHVDSVQGEPPFIAEEMAGLLTADDTPPEVDSVEWAEQRARKAKRRQNEKGGTAPEGQSGDGTRTPPAPDGYAARGRARNQRVAGGKRAWQDIRKLDRGIKSVGSRGQRLQSSLRPAPEQKSNTETQAMTDPTGIMLILAMLGGSRR